MLLALELRLNPSFMRVIFEQSAGPLQINIYIFLLAVFLCMREHVFLSLGFHGDGDEPVSALYSVQMIETVKLLETDETFLCS